MSEVALYGFPASRGVHLPALDRVAHLLFSLVLAVGAWIVMLAVDAQGLGNEAAFALLTLMILSYSVLQAVGVSRNNGQRILMNPTVFYALVGNGLMLGFGGLLYLMPDEIQVHVGSPDITYWMNYYLALMVLANIGLWTGYRSRAAAAIAAGIRQSTILRRLLRRSFRVRYSTIMILLAVSLIARLIAVWSGIFGYSTTVEGLVDTTAFRQYLSLGAQLGTFALIAVAMDHFSKAEPPRVAPWLLGVLGYEAFFGLVSGFKAAVVMPFLIVLAVAYLLRGRLLLKWFAFSLLALVVAYTLIEPFRQFRHEEFQYQSENLSYITGAVTSPQDRLRQEEIYGLRAGIAHFLSTQGNIHVYAEGIRYRVESEGQLWDPPEFLRDIFLAPVLALVPRALWDDKPELSHGGWYRSVVLQGPEGTAVGMSPVTYLYFAGGAVAVFLGFFAFGIAQSAIFHGFLTHGAGGALVFLGLFSFMRGPDSVYYTYIIDLIRMLPLLLIVQFVTLAAEPRHSQRSVSHS